MHITLISTCTTPKEVFYSCKVSTLQIFIFLGRFENAPERNKAGILYLNAFKDEKERIISEETRKWIDGLPS